MPKSRKSKRPKVEEEIFSVEKILDSKMDDGKKYYFLKWHNYPSSENTWEPEENLNCPALIEAFEKSKIKKEPSASNDKTEVVKVKKPKKVDTNADTLPSTPTTTPTVIATKPSTPIETNDRLNGEDEQDVKIPDVSGFLKGWEAEEILGATEEKGQVLFLIKWKDIEQPELVYATEANLAIPQTVIKFYESKLTWHDEQQTSGFKFCGFCGLFAHLQKLNPQTPVYCRKRWWNKLKLNRRKRWWNKLKLNQTEP